MIKNSEPIISHFGYWPNFCDGKIEHISFDQQGVIELFINYVDSDQNKKANIGLRFSGVTDVELSELRLENIIDQLTITGVAPFVVSIDGTYGLCGNFNCTGAVVIAFSI
jgi:Immunity protein 50